MTAIATRAPASGLGFFGRLVSAVSDRWEQHVEYKRTLDELRRLSDRELEDIGIARYDIRAIARGAHGLSN
ncbi:MAG: DUF1127 domain-containing protein [Pseudomonadota bacterium]